MKKIFLSLLISLNFFFLGCGNTELKGVEDKVLIAPIAVAGEDVTIRTDGNITLTAKESSDADGSIIAYSWEENGTVLSTGIELKEYKSLEVGTHVITLTILDNDELNSTDTVNVFVTLKNQEPVADAGKDQRLHIGDMITLDGSGSFDSDGEIVSYKWREKDTTEVLSTGVELKNYTPITEAIHILELIVTDNEGLSSNDFVYVSALNNKAPVANAGNDQTIRTGVFITLDGNKSFDVDGEIFYYSWVENNVTLGTGINLENYMTTIVGEHNITLTVTDNDGSKDIDRVTVTVLPENVAPVAHAGSDFKHVDIGSFVTLNGSLSYDSDGTIVAYEWKENNITLGTGVNLLYTPSTEGIHILELTVTDNEGLTHTDSAYVTTLFNIAPVANAGSDISIRIGDKVTLEGNTSIDSDGVIVSYIWEEGNKTIGTSTLLIDYLPSQPGMHILTLTVIDNDGAKHSDNVFVNVVINTAPIANAGNDQTIRTAETITLYGDKSNDVDGQIVLYQWSERDIILGTGVNLVNYQTDIPGEHNITLIVTDNEGASSFDEVTINVLSANIPPKANAGKDFENIDTDISLLLEGNLSIDIDGTIVAYEWKENNITLGTGVNLRYTPSTEGVHIIELTVTDNEGLSDTDSTFVSTLFNIPPIANAGRDESIRIGSRITLDGNLSRDRDGVIVSYLWEEGNRTVGMSERLIDYFPTTAGFHTLTLTVTDNDGATHSDDIFVNVVENTYPLANAGNDQQIVVGEFITLDGNRSNDLDGTIVQYSWVENGVILSTGVRLENYRTNLVGEHNITLAVTDNDGYENRDTVVINVIEKNIPPFANAGVDQSNIHVGSTITLSGSLSTDTDGTIISYVWKENNIVLGTGVSLQYTPTTVGVHIITLTVTDNGGLSHSDSVYISTLANITPVADAGDDVSIRIGQRVTLDANGSVDSDGTISTYQWSENGTILGTSERLIDYLPSTAGIHTLTVTVVDNDGASHSDNIFVNVVENTYPLANAGNDQIIRVGEHISLDGSRSNDLDGTIVQYSWVENGVVLSTGEDLVDYTSSVIGLHTITLTVIDNDGYSNSDTVDVLIRLANIAPVADAGDNKNTRVNVDVVLDGSGSTDSDGVISTYEWMESGTTLGTGVTLNYSSLIEGVHTVELSVVDNEGLTSSDSIFVTVVGNNSPIANAGNDQTLIEGDTITLDGTNSNDTDGSIVSYSWEENGVVLSTGEKLINYSSVNIGNHNIELTVTDNDGLSSSDSVVVTVIAANVAPVADAGADITIDVNTTTVLSASNSSDSDGTIIGYEWKEGSQLLGTAIDLNYTSSVLGGHTIILKVRDNEGLEDTDSVYITVTN